MTLHDLPSKCCRNHSLDSGNRYYGAFGYQEVLFLSIIPLTILKKIFALDPTYANALMFLATRILWALSALAIVVMTYFISKELFRNQRAALISMFLIAISPGFIAWSHISQTRYNSCILVYIGRIADSSRMEPLQPEIAFLCSNRCRTYCQCKNTLVASLFLPRSWLPFYASHYPEPWDMALS